MRPFRTVRSALLVALAAALPVASGDVFGGDSGPTPMARAQTSIDRFARVAPGVYRGAQPGAEGFRALRALGVRTVVNLRMEHNERAEVGAAGMRSVAIPMAGGDAAPAPGKRTVRRFFDVLLDPGARPVFVHCYHGKDRAGAMMAAYRIEVDGWSRKQAIREMHALGFEDSHRNLLRWVQTYERRGYQAPAGPAAGDGAPGDPLPSK